MKIEDAPLHQNRWRLLADAPLGERGASSSNEPPRLINVTFGARADCRMTLSVAEAKDLRDWLTTCLAGEPRTRT